MTPDSENESLFPHDGARAHAPAEPPAPPPAAARPLPAAAAVLVGAACAVLGLAPWLVTGVSLPLQNIWREVTRPEDMPLALLPLSQYFLVATVAMVVVGSALAGAASRLASRRGRPPRLWLVAAGAMAVQSVALAQAAVVLASGLEDSARARVYLWGMVVGVCVGIVVGLLVMVGIGRAGTAGATIAITFGALALSEWLPTLIYPIGAAPSYDVPLFLSHVVRWLPVVTVALAVGWCGAASVRRAAASVTSLLALWIVPSAVIAFSHAVGSRVYLQNPSELIPAGLQVFRGALTSASTAQHVLVAVVGALMVGIALFAARTVRDTPIEGPAENA
ncbi:MAG: hypothetical protein ACK4MD_07140 [Demequina sp.]